MDPRNDHTQGSTGAGSSGVPPRGAPPARPNANPSGQHGGWGRKRWLVLGVILGFVVLGVVSALVYSAKANTFSWREEVAFHDGGFIALTWKVWFVPGEGFREQVGRQQLTFTHPTTGQSVIWEDPGKVGGRLIPTILDVDTARLFLVGLAPTGPDYGGFGCPTPPYIVFRYDAGTWVRVPLAELPSRFERANLLGFGAEDLIRRSNRFLTARQIAAWHEDLRKRTDTAHYAFIDRRIRNPMVFGCDRGAIERVYGVEKYDEWRKSGTWLDKTEAEIRTLLGRKGEGGKP